MDEQHDEGITKRTNSSRRSFLKKTVAATAAATAAEIMMGLPLAHASGPLEPSDVGWKAFDEGVGYSTLDLNARFVVDLVALGKTLVIDSRESLAKGADPFMSEMVCGSGCRTSVGLLSINEPASLSAGIQVVQFYVHGETKDFLYSVSMDPETEQLGRLEVPVDQSASSRKGKFWLNGRMIVRLRFKNGGHQINLVSRNPVLQEAVAQSWPPVSAQVRSQREDEYVALEDRDGPTVAIVKSGVITLGQRTHPFLASRVRIKSFEYLHSTGQSASNDAHYRDVAAVRFSWEDLRASVPGVDHYHVYRRPYMGHKGAEVHLGGHIHATSFTDSHFDSANAWEYRVVPVTKDLLGYDVDGIADTPLILGPLRK